MTKDEAIAWADKMLEDPRAQTDGGCTFSPDFDFEICCLRHDVMLNYNQGITDKEADRYLRECIADHGHPIKAWIYWAAVRYGNIVGDFKFGVAIIAFALIVVAGYYFG